MARRIICACRDARSPSQAAREYLPVMDKAIRRPGKLQKLRDSIKRKIWTPDDPYDWQIKLPNRLLGPFVLKLSRGLLCYHNQGIRIPRKPLDWSKMDSQKSRFSGWHLVQCRELKPTDCHLQFDASPHYYVDTDVFQYAVEPRDPEPFRETIPHDRACCAMTFYQHLTFLVELIRPIEEQIREKAYGIFESRTRDGDCISDWMAAEHDILSELRHELRERFQLNEGAINRTLENWWTPEDGHPRRK